MNGTRVSKSFVILKCSKAKSSGPGQQLDIDDRPRPFGVDAVGPGAHLLGLDEHLGEAVQLPDRVRFFGFKLVDDALGLLSDPPPERGRAAQLLRSLNDFARGSREPYLREG